MASITYANQTEFLKSVYHANLRVWNWYSQDTEAYECISKKFIVERAEVHYS